MQRVGEILRTKRLEKNLSFQEIERVTKIKRKFLKSLEKDDFKDFSSEAYARGFIKNYAEFLGLSSEKVLAVWRRQLKARRDLPPFREVDEGSFLKITPNRIKLGLILIPLFVFFGYLFKQYQFLIQGPSLTVFEPSQNLVTEKRNIFIRGKTDHEVRIFVNNEEVFADEKGEFVKEIFLLEGMNEITIVAEDLKGRQRTIIREVTFEPL